MCRDTSGLSVKSEYARQPVLRLTTTFVPCSENLLLAIISDKLSTIREFKISKLNFDAGEYFDHIDWQNTAVTEPPLTVNASQANIRLFVATHGDSTVEFDRYSYHTEIESVEQYVKIVTEASAGAFWSTGSRRFHTILFRGSQHYASF